MRVRGSQEQEAQSHGELPFDKYRSNVHSQHGEDGVIAEIFRRLGVSDANENWCVEFGAWDGKHLSNTLALVRERKFRAVYIEGDKARFGDLEKTVESFPAIFPICAYVSATRGDPASLDKLLASTPIPSEFALLSIDIDSHDVDVWESVESYRPQVVVIEINSSVPPGIVWRHGPRTPGNTFSAACNVAREKGYALVCHTGNLIFVRRDLVDRLGIDERFFKYPELLFQYDTEWFPPGLFAPGSRGLVPRFLSRTIFRRRH